MAGSLERLNISNDSTDLAIPEVDDLAAVATASGGVAGVGEMKFEQTRVASATSTKITTGDGYSSEEATANASHSRRVQADGVHYEESGQAAAMKARLEIDGVTAEKAAAVKQVTFQNCTLATIRFAQSKTRLIIIGPHEQSALAIFL